MTTSTSSASRTRSPEPPVRPAATARHAAKASVPTAPVTPAKPSVLDLREQGNHPLALRYSEVHTQAVLSGRFEHGRAQGALDTSRATPFVMAARRAVAHGLHRTGVREAMLEVLRPYYEQVRPRHAADWLGLTDPASASAPVAGEASAPPALLAAPPWGAVFPWRARSVQSYTHAYADAARAENLAVGRDVGIEDGWLFCGPVSEEKARIEAERILYVLRRIADEGYRRSDDGDGDVRATALVHETGAWRWLITAGNHRASAAAALGFDEIPIRVNLVISRADAAHWRHVREALFTLEQAQAVFDRYFHASPPPVLRPWLAGALDG